MEKKAPRPNVRVNTPEKKNATTSSEETLTRTVSSSYKKADEMESGFIKTRKSTNQKNNESPDYVEDNGYSAHEEYEQLENKDNGNISARAHDTSNATGEMKKPLYGTNILEDTNTKKHSIPKNTAQEAEETFSKKQETESPPHASYAKRKKGIQRSTTKAPEIPEEPKKIQSGYQVTLSPSVCITAFITLIITLAFIFLFGLIIGKGMVPVAEKTAPEKLQPQMQLTETNTTQKEVLPKEDLQFMTNLKTEPTTQTNTTEETRAIEQNLADAIGKKQDEIIPSSRLFDFNIRAAAFRNSDQADTLRQKLEGAGYRTTLVTEKDSNGRNWYFVHVLLRGSEVRLKEAQEDFKKYAIRDSIIKEQKEVK